MIPGFRSYSSNFLSNINQKNIARKEKNQESPKGTSGAEAACCSITSLDELANAANQSSNLSNPQEASMSESSMTSHMSDVQHAGHNTFHNPFASSVLEVALTPFVSVLAGAGIYIGYSIYRDFNDKKLSLEDAIAKIHTILEDNQFEGQKLNLQAVQITAYKAYISVLKEQYDEVDFQQAVAGKMSSVMSTGIAVGQFVMPLGAASLLGLSTIGAAHTIHMIRNLNQSIKKIGRATRIIENLSGDNGFFPENRESILQDSEIRKRYFNKKRRHEVVNLGGWASFTLGAATLGVAQSVALASGNGAAFEPVMAGVSALGAGVATTVVENNILTSSRFVTAMPVHAWNSMSTLSSEDRQESWYEKLPNNQTQHKTDHKFPAGVITYQDIRQRNIDANKRRIISKEYRKSLFSKRSFLQKSQHLFQRIRQKTLAYGTLGLVPHFTAGMKFNDKVRVSKHGSMDDIQKVRLQVIDRLGNLTEDRLKNIDYVEGDNELLNSIIQNGQQDGVGKVLSMRALKKKFYYELTPIAQKNWRGKIKNDSDNNRIFRLKRNWYGKVMKNENGENILKERYQNKVKYVLKDEYKSLLESNSSASILGSVMPVHSIEERQETMVSIFNTPPCCPSNAESQGIIEYIQKTYFMPTESNLTKKERETKNKVAKLIQEATDHYLLYQNRKQSKEHIAIWSNLSDSYQRHEELEKSQPKGKISDFPNFPHNQSLPRIAEEPNHDDKLKTEVESLLKVADYMRKNATNERRKNLKYRIKEYLNNSNIFQAEVKKNISKADLSRLHDFPYVTLEEAFDKIASQLEGASEYISNHEYDRALNILSRTGLFINISYVSSTLFNHKGDRARNLSI